MPGFRRGPHPKRLIEKRFGQDSATRSSSRSSPRPTKKPSKTTSSTPSASRRSTSPRSSSPESGTMQVSLEVEVAPGIRLPLDRKNLRQEAQARSHRRTLEPRRRKPAANTSATGMIPPSRSRTKTPSSPTSRSPAKTARSSPNSPPVSSSSNPSADNIARHQIRRPGREAQGPDLGATVVQSNQSPPTSREQPTTTSKSSSATDQGHQAPAPPRSQQGIRQDARLRHRRRAQDRPQGTPRHPAGTGNQGRHGPAGLSLSAVQYQARSARQALPARRWATSSAAGRPN